MGDRVTLREAVELTGLSAQDLLERIDRGELEAERQGDELVLAAPAVEQLRAG